MFDLLFISPANVFWRRQVDALRIVRCAHRASFIRHHRGNLFSRQSQTSQKSSEALHDPHRAFSILCYGFNLVVIEQNPRLPRGRRYLGNLPRRQRLLLALQRFL